MTTQNNQQNGKVAIVTGSAAGLGNAIATRLAKDGFKVVLHDISEDNLKTAKDEFDKAGYESISVVGDASKKPTKSAWLMKQSRHLDR